MLTPTSWYWNCVLTSELTSAVAAPVWYEPVAIGMREPIFNVAFCWSAARMRGFCRILVLLSVSSAFAVAATTVTAKSFEFRCARSKSVGLFVPDDGVQFVLPVGHVVGAVVVGGTSCTLTLPGHVIPRL